jgi:membrane protease YdiL (CAAX protease family)
VVAINAVASNLYEKNGLALIVFVALQDAVIVGAAILFSLVRYRVGGEMLGLKKFSAALGCWMSASLLIASYFIRLLYSVIAMAFGYRPSVQDVLNRLDTQGVAFWASFLAVAVIAPFAEEIVFRGFIYGGLRARFGVAVATISSTLFFTALHFSIEQFIPIFVLGLFLAWLYEKTGSLYPGIILHATNNAIALLLLAALRASGALPGF